MFIKLNDIDIKVIDNVNISVSISVNINVNVISQWASTSSLVSLLFVNSCATASDNMTQRAVLDIFTNEKT